MINSYYCAQQQYSQAPPASNNPFQQQSSTNPFRKSVYLPQQVTPDISASHSSSQFLPHGQQLLPQPLYGQALVHNSRSSSPSPSPSGWGYTPATYASPLQPAQPMAAARGLPGPFADPVASLTGQFGHMDVGVDGHPLGRPQHVAPSPLNPMLTLGIFEQSISLPAAASYQPLSRRTSSTYSPSSPSTPTRTPSPCTPAPIVQPLSSSASVHGRTSSPRPLPLRRGSPARHVRSIREVPVRYQPAMRESGRPGTLWMCPKTTTITYRTTWHVLRASGMLLTCCPPCYVAFAAGGSLGFEAEELESKKCMFHTKRAQALLLAGDAAGIAAYFRTRARVKDCPGVSACSATSGIAWYRPINGPPGTVCCEACFEDHAKANTWESRFERVAHPPEAQWRCDFAKESVRDGYIKLAPDHWDEWRRLVERRNAVRPCTSYDVKAGSRKWYTVTPAITGLVVCEACYLDKATTSRFATHFVPYAVNNPNDMYMCDFSSLYFVFPLVVADETNAWGKFQTAASRVMDCAMAQMNGARQQFWGLGPGPRGRDSDWDVCEKCYASLFEPYGFDRFLQPRPPPQASRSLVSRARQCDMCPGAPHKAEMLARLQEAAYAGVFSYFSEWARSAAGSRQYNRPEGLCYATRGWE